MDDDYTPSVRILFEDSIKVVQKEELEVLPVSKQFQTKYILVVTLDKVARDTKNVTPYKEVVTRDTAEVTKDTAVVT